jgi:rare lipoprotein A
MMLAACSTSGPQTASAKRTSTKEYFAESEYGVKASPQSVDEFALRTAARRRARTGRQALQGQGQVVSPRKKTRTTAIRAWHPGMGTPFTAGSRANGEVYDMTHLTAAHPTMPLPSYARVTNTANGSSVIVRVNDRGPFAHGRIIDLSRRAAELLDYTQKGVAKVEVEYVGRAPLARTG